MTRYLSSVPGLAAAAFLSPFEGLSSGAPGRRAFLSLLSLSLLLNFSPSPEQTSLVHSQSPSFAFFFCSSECVGCCDGLSCLASLGAEQSGVHVRACVRRVAAAAAAVVEPSDRGVISGSVSSRNRSNGCEVLCASVCASAGRRSGGGPHGARARAALCSALRKTSAIPRLGRSRRLRRRRRRRRRSEACKVSERASGRATKPMWKVEEW